MLNNVWTSLVNKVEATKKCYEELEAAMTTTNDHLNNGISVLDVRLDQLEDKFWTICNVQEDVCVAVNKQQCQIYNMDQQISFYMSARNFYGFKFRLLTKSQFPRSLISLVIEAPHLLFPFISLLRTHQKTR